VINGLVARALGAAMAPKAAKAPRVPVVDAPAPADQPQAGRQEDARPPEDRLGDPPEDAPWRAVLLEVGPPVADLLVEGLPADVRPEGGLQEVDRQGVDLARDRHAASNATTNVALTAASGCKKSWRPPALIVAVNAKN
jgi:hypothetical protein